MHQYPRNLLPFKKNKIKRCDNCILVRKLETTEDIFDDDGYLIPTFIELENVNSLFCYSTNLLNCNHECDYCDKIDYIFINVLDKTLSRTLYKENDDEIPKTANIKFDYQEKSYFLLRIKYFHNKPEKYQYTIPNKSPDKKTCKFIVEHKPTLVNNCHFEINAYSQEGNRITNIKSKWKEEIHGKFKSMLIKYAFNEENKRNL